MPKTRKHFQRKPCCQGGRTRDSFYPTFQITNYIARGSLNFHLIGMKQRPFYSVTFLLYFPIKLFMKINFKKLQEIKQINNNDIF